METQHETFKTLNFPIFNIEKVKKTGKYSNLFKDLSLNNQEIEGVELKNNKPLKSQKNKCRIRKRLKFLNQEEGFRQLKQNLEVNSFQIKKIKNKRVFKKQTQTSFNFVDEANIYNASFCGVYEDLMQYYQNLSHKNSSNIYEEGSSSSINNQTLINEAYNSLEIDKFIYNHQNDYNLNDLIKNDKIDLNYDIN